jgi:hypothetical protein
MMVDRNRVRIGDRLVVSFQRTLCIPDDCRISGQTSAESVSPHPGGRDLQFSFQDNVLLDYEDRAGGRRAVADVCRVHYRTPTEPGS